MFVQNLSLQVDFISPVAAISNWQYIIIYHFSNIKATDGEAPADSDDEFAKDFNPVTDDTSVDQDNIPLQDEESSSSEPSSPVPPVEAKLLQGLITSAISQGLSSIANREDDQETQGKCNSSHNPSCAVTWGTKLNPHIIIPCFVYQKP